MDHDPAALDSLSNDFDAGLPIPAADPALLKKVWEGMKAVGAEAGFRSNNRALGLGAFGLCPGEFENRPHTDFYYAWLRSFLLASLDRRSVLKGFKVGDAYADRVFSAMATFPCTKSEIGECVTLQMMSEDPGEKWDEMRRQATARGYDFSKPEIDSKFLDYLEERATDSED